ncbi:hypothetical protein L1887_05480 [Cichorium endivia]|nr:hypothetical protein L1887_05480 [Cichorium endivia]
MKKGLTLAIAKAFSLSISSSFIIIILFDVEVRALVEELSEKSYMLHPTPSSMATSTHTTPSTPKVPRYTLVSSIDKLQHGKLAFGTPIID